MIAYENIHVFFYSLGSQQITTESQDFSEKALKPIEMVKSNPLTINPTERALESIEKVKINQLTINPSSLNENVDFNGGKTLPGGFISTTVVLSIWNKQP